MPQCLLRQVMVVQPDKAVQRLLQILSAVEVVRTQYLAKPAIKTLDHAIGLRRLGLGHPVFDIQALAQLVELVLACGLAAAASKQPVRELLSVVVREDGTDLE